MECTFCKKIFSYKSSLKFHQKTTKYCLKLQGKDEDINSVSCKYCNKEFTTKQNQIFHYGCCKDKELYDKLKEKEEELKKEFSIVLKEKDDEINNLKQKIAELNGCLFTMKDIAKQQNPSR